MKKLCIICVSGFPVPAVKGGAIETLVQELIDENEKKPHYYITLLTMDDHQASASDLTYKYTTFVRFAKILWKDRLSVRANRLKNSIFHTNTQFIPSYKKSAIEWLKENGTNYDLFIDETGMEEYIGACEAIPFAKRVYHLHGVSEFNVLHAQYTNYTISISKYVADSWQKLTGKGREKSYILKNCIDQSKFRKSTSRNELHILRQKYGIDNNTFVILFAGRIIPEKGVKELAEAVAQINDENVLLLIAGGIYYTTKGRTTEYYKELQAISKETCSRIEFTGYIDNKNLHTLHEIANAAAIPSRWQEPAGLVVLEAEAAGNPVIATRSGGIPEFIGEECGILVDNDDNIVENLKNAILELKNNPQKRTLMAENGRKYSEKYNVENYFSEFCKILDDILKRSNCV